MTAEQPPVIQRQRTAISRRRFSVPMRTAMEHGIIVKGRTVLDYGCGRGSDLQLLTALGYKASGFDPHFRPVPYAPADVVNLGYVLNVIEDRVQRRAALLDAWANARLALVVGVYLGSQQGETALDDGYVTKAGTFQWWPTEAGVEQYLALWVAQPTRLARGVYLLSRQ